MLTRTTCVHSGPDCHFHVFFFQDLFCCNLHNQLESEVEGVTEWGQFKHHAQNHGDEGIYLFFFNFIFFAFGIFVFVMLHAQRLFGEIVLDIM